MRSGNCVLYTGAGFSAAATSHSGTPLPTSGLLAAALWDFAGLAAGGQPYGGQDLQKVFEAARKAKGDAALLAFLGDRLRVATYPNSLKVIAQIFWHRIYTTNVDDLAESIYKQSSGPRLDVINAIHHRTKERDQFLESIQCIKLNGTLDKSCDSLTFGTRQVVKRMASHDPWWDVFVGEYSTHVTLFVGSGLNEPLLDQAMESRGERFGAVTEGRKRAFLVAKPIDPLLAARLGDLNITAVNATAEDFFFYIEKLIEPLPTRFDVLETGKPHQVQFGQLVKSNPALADPAAKFLNVFQPVEPVDIPRNYVSPFHHGAEPTWLDIAAHLDAPREITNAIQARVQELVGEGRGGSLLLLGHRGSGKTTALMRLAADTQSVGIPSYFCDADDVSPEGDAAVFLEVTRTKIVLFLDNADRLGGRGYEFVERLRASRAAPILVATARASSVDLAREFDAESHTLGEMSEPDIRALIKVMRSAHSLGEMQGSPDASVFEAFARRAKKQMLVAMKEVTSGLDFERIIAREFLEIPHEDERLLYLVVCLATEVGFAPTIDLLATASPIPPARLREVLARDLRMIVVRSIGMRERYVARHARIAESVIEKSAPKTLLARAYEHLLPAMVSFMDPRGRGEPRTVFNHYRRLISHRTIFSRFNRDLNEAREIFSALEPHAASDPHYWLQFGSLELEYASDLSRAETFLVRAHGLDSEDYYVRVALAHLRFKQGIAAHSPVEARSLRDQAETELRALIAERGDDNNHPWHILLTQMLHWLDVWEPDKGKRLADLERLLETAEEACEARPHSAELAEAKEKVMSSYLRMGGRVS